MYMRKALVIIFAVAVLGGASFYVTNNKSKNNVVVSPQSDISQASQTPTSNKPTTNSSSPSSSYKDGTYTGKVADTPYGPVQITAIISGGKITDVNFLEMPTDEQRSRTITAQAKPMLKQAAITAQSASIDFVSGATSTSYGYQESLQAALDKAHNS
jgi:uncharacterized protein with FMN-binding domain